MRKLITAILITVFVCQSYGWGSTGHRATGMITTTHLNKKAKKKIEALLGQESLAMASTWMDDIRSDSTFDYTHDFHWVTVETGQTYEQSKKNPNGDLITTIERLIAELKSGKL